MTTPRRVPFRVLLAGLAGLGLLALAGWPVTAAPALKVTPEDLLKKARADGKYSMLLRQIKVEKDAGAHGEFRDLGYSAKREYAGYTDLPAGWWVYVAPYWYIWRDHVAIARTKRSYGPEQATGEPDSPGAGDRGTAWCHQTTGAPDEWLICEYAEPIIPTAVLVHENYYPGALYRVTVFKLDGEEVEVWKGDDPTPKDAGSGVSEIPVKVDYKVSRVRIHLNSKDGMGWHEIDAVGVRDKAKKMHWATAVEASSTYAQPYPATDLQAVLTEDRFRKLEDEMKQLRQELQEIKRLLKEK